MDQQGQNGLVSTYQEGWRNRATPAWIIAVVLLLFYVLLYWTNIFDPLARVIKLQNKWYLYGFLYTAAMGLGASYYLKRHGNSRYNRIRIVVNLLIQVLFAFALPYFMVLFQGKDYYFSYLWPLKIEYLYPDTIGQYPVYIIGYSLVASLLLVPILTLRLGKRWYCSWVCGCGALANTAGDPWRHLSFKSERSWRFERISIHSVLVLALVTTIAVVVDFAIGQTSPMYHAAVSSIRSTYGFVVGAMLSGIVGVAVYPLLGPRIWCRFFCPMAALLGIIQRWGRFRIRVKPDMCISCGNCSTYCEMGIDVRSYAQTNQTFTRASCVGCGMCAHTCPRGVLQLTNKPASVNDAG